MEIREYTKNRTFTFTNDPTSWDEEKMKLSALIRIADNLDKVAQEYDKIINDRNYYKAGYERKKRELENMARYHKAEKSAKSRFKNELTRAKEVISGLHLEVIKHEEKIDYLETWLELEGHAEEFENWKSDMEKEASN